MGYTFIRPWVEGIKNIAGGIVGIDLDGKVSGITFSTPVVEGAAIVGGTYADTLTAYGSITGSTAVNWASGNVMTATLTGDVTFTDSGAVAGQTMTYILTQDGTGGWEITWPTTTWIGVDPATVDTDPTKVAVFTRLYTGSGYIGFFAGASI